MRLGQKINLTANTRRVDPIVNFFARSRGGTERLLRAAPVPPDNNAAAFKFFSDFGGKVWNVSSPFAGLDFTGQHYDSNKSGALVTDRCFVSTNHHCHAIGEQVSFYTAAGAAVTRTIAARQLMSRPANNNGPGTRMWVCLLDEAVPDTIAVYRLVPTLPTPILEDPLNDGTSYASMWPWYPSYSILGLDNSRDPKWSLRWQSRLFRDAVSLIRGEMMEGYESTTGSSSVFWPETLDRVYGSQVAAGGDSGSIAWMLAPDGAELLLIGSTVNARITPTMFKAEIQDDLRATVDALGQDGGAVRSYELAA